MGNIIGCREIDGSRKVEFKIQNNFELLKTGEPYRVCLLCTHREQNIAKEPCRSCRYTSSDSAVE